MAKESKPLMILLAGKNQNLDNIRALIRGRNFDFYAADGGYYWADHLGVALKYILGDFDSSTRPEGENIISFPSEKDETDSELALNLALKEGYREIWMIAPFGGRLDHTVANLGLLERCGQAGASLFLYDGINLAFLLNEGRHLLDRRFRYVSFFAQNHPATLSLSGFKYELDHYQLVPGVPIGISNEPIEKCPTVDVHQGRILCICIESESLEEL